MKQKLEIINNWNLKKLIAELEIGQIKIPRFQRGYIWEKSKIIKLLNSIGNQYPIGSFFLWIAPKHYKNFIRDTEDIELTSNIDHDKYKFILDGQQRIVSLYLSLRGKNVNGTDYSQICYNLDRKIFHIPRLKREKNNIPVWQIFDHDNFMEIHTNYAIKDRKLKTNYAKILHECHQVFMNYPISVVKSYNDDLEEVVEIFERINQGGKRLSIFDLVQATTWDKSFDLKDKIQEFNKQRILNKYKNISNKVFTQALAINVFEDCKNTTQLKLTGEICKKNWDKTKHALNSTIAFLKQMHIRDDFSTYQLFIPVIQNYFFRSGYTKVKETHQKQIEKWFWDAKFSKRYSVANHLKIKEDINWIKEMLA
ncbi:MAG: DUF262 domain-containing protein [Chlorobi bacterium]|nr:DUF262 domain-containing protein [Chlorobiota bacterium]